jgi:hypothetical protein
MTAAGAVRVPAVQCIEQSAKRERGAWRDAVPNVLGASSGIAVTPHRWNLPGAATYTDHDFFSCVR